MNDSQKIEDRVGEVRDMAQDFFNYLGVFTLGTNNPFPKSNPLFTALKAAEDVDSILSVFGGTGEFDPSKLSEAVGEDTSTFDYGDMTQSALDHAASIEEVALELKRLKTQVL